MIVAAGLTLTTAAQKTEKQVATLQHGDQTTVFYGIDAFKSAYNAAADTLDVITLSSGEFNVPSAISKSITIYGVGCENDSIIQRTCLNGNVILKTADQKVNGVHIEGLYSKGNITVQSVENDPIHNLSIVKCKVNGYVYLGVDNYDCIVRQSIVNSVKGSGYAQNLLISNCHFGYDMFTLDGFDKESTIVVNHSIIKKIFYGASAAHYINNIIFQSSLPTGSNGANNIFITTSGTSTTETKDGSWYNMRGKDVWADEKEDGNYVEDKTFELKKTENDSVLYIGTDNTEIGLHGGQYAWNKTPVIPRITEYTIDTKNVNNGKLTVSIKAEAQTKE